MLLQTNILISFVDDKIIVCLPYYSINCHEPLLNFWTLRVGAYLRWALIRGWALITFFTI